MVCKRRLDRREASSAVNRRAPASARLAQNQITGHGLVGLLGRRVLLAFRQDVLPSDNRSAFLRLLDGILAALA